MARLSFDQAFNLRALIDGYADALLAVDQKHDTQERAAEAAARYREALAELNGHINAMSGARMQHADAGWCRISRPGMFSDATKQEAA